MKKDFIPFDPYDEFDRIREEKRAAQERELATKSPPPPPPAPSPKPVEKQPEAPAVKTPEPAPVKQTVEVGTQFNTKERVSKADFDRLNREAPVLADILKYQGFAEYEKARPEFSAAYVRAQTTAEKQREATTPKKAEAQPVNKYSGWTAQELVSGKVENGVYIPAPYGMKGGKYVPPPAEVKKALAGTTIDNIPVASNTGKLDKNALKVLEVQGNFRAGMGALENATKTYFEGIYKPYVEAVKSDKPGIEKAAAIGLHTADLFVIGVWARRWNEMTPGERFFNIGIDLLTLYTLGLGKPLIKTLTRGSWKSAVEAGVKDFNIRAGVDKAIEGGARISATEKASLKSRWTNIEKAFNSGDPERIEAAGADIKQIGARLELNEMVKRGELIEANAQDIGTFTKVAKKNPPDSALRRELKSQADTLQRDLEAMQRAEKRTSREPLKEVLKEKQELTERQIKEIKKKVQVAEAPKVKTILEDWFATEKGGPLAKTEKGGPLVKTKPSVKAPAPKAKPVIAPKIKVGNKNIPVREFATKTASEVAREYKVNTRAIEKAATKLSPKQRSLFDELVKIQNARQTRLIEQVETRTRTLPRALPLQRTTPVTKTQPATKTVTKTETKTLPKVLPQEKTKTETKTKTLPRVLPRSKVVTKITPRLRPPLPKGGASDKQKREFIKAAGGAVAWRQGELHGRGVYHVLVKPFTEDYHLTVVGPPPSGAKVATGPGSAAKTISLLYGRGPARAVKVEGGAVDPTISEGGDKISFERDPSISNRPPAISARERMLAERRAMKLSGGGFRISPKTPRLR